MMNIRKFCWIPEINLAVQREIREWGGDAPLHVIYSVTGVAIADEFDRIDEAERNFLIDLVESCLTCRHHQVQLNIGTHLLDTLLEQASRCPSLSSRILGRLGRASGVCASVL